MKLTKSHQDGDRVYVRDGEEVPEGVETQQSERGSRYFKWKSGPGHAGWEHQRRKSRRMSRSVGLVDELIPILEKLDMDLEEALDSDNYRVKDIVRHFSADRGCDPKTAVRQLKLLLALADHLEDHDVEEEIPEAQQEKTGLDLLWAHLEPYLAPEGEVGVPDGWVLKKLVLQHSNFRADLQRVAAALSERDGYPTAAAQRKILETLYQKWGNLYHETQAR